MGAFESWCWGSNRPSGGLAGGCPNYKLQMKGKPGKAGGGSHKLLEGGVKVI